MGRGKTRDAARTAMSPGFELLLFSTNPTTVREAVGAGIDGIIVDWEHLGKAERQRGADTEINGDTLEDLLRVRAATDAPVICRVNAFERTTTAREIDAAVEAGAAEVLLPMVRGRAEVEQTMALARGRCGVGILVETVAATETVEALARLPLSRVYVGLNDLAIERRTPNLFTAAVDGTVERVRQAFRTPFGFGGLTLPESGHPIPCRLLIAEMARLRCTFAFLRRSFRRDMRGRVMAQEVPRLRAALSAARSRPVEEVARDRSAFEQAVMAWV